jgi:hypothetical protein
MSIVNNLIDDFINQHEILPNAFFIKHSTVVSEYFHHAVNDIHHKAWTNVVFCCRNEVNSKLFGKEEIYAIDCLNFENYKGIDILQMMEGDLLPKD